MNKEVAFAEQQYYVNPGWWITNGTLEPAIGKKEQDHPKGKQLPEDILNNKLNLNDYPDKKPKKLSPSSTSENGDELFFRLMPNRNRSA